jgi:dynein intermediate chain
MSDKRRAEIEAKKLKLAELRKARVDRQRADVQRRGSDVSLIPFFLNNTTSIVN